MEEWRNVIGYEGLYEVSNKGRVRSRQLWGRSGDSGGPTRHLSPGNVRGYMQLNLAKDGVHKSALVHRLVAIAFVGLPPTPDHQVNHKDFDKSNNVPENLEWVTQTENNIYSKDVIPRNRGERNHSKLKEHEVMAIRELHALGATYGQLASHYKVSTQTIFSIVKRRKWKHVP